MREDMQVVGVTKMQRTERDVDIICCGSLTGAAGRRKKNYKPFIWQGSYSAELF